jgi:uncharacterized spore protein YtfJ
MAERAGPGAPYGDGPPLAGIDRLVEHTAAELRRMLDVKQVVGEPLTFGGTTVVPLVSVGFGFGAGGGGGGGDEGSGGGGGGGGAGGVKPVAVLILDEAGVRLAPIPGKPSALGKLGEALADAIQKRRGKAPDAEAGER